MASQLSHENIWTDKCCYDDAERQHFENLAKLPKAIKGLVKEAVVLAPSSLVTPFTSSTPFIPPIPTTNISKITKSSKNALIAQQIECSDLTKTPVPLKEAQKNEKSSKRNKKAKEAMRQRELMDSVPNNVAPLATVIMEVASCDPVISPEVPAKAPKTKEAKEKMNKSDRKRANKKEKEDLQKAEEKLKIENNEEKVICEKASSPVGGAAQCNSSPYSLASEVAKARQHIKNSLECMDSFLAGVPNVEVINRINSLETTNAQLTSALEDLKKLVLSLQAEVKSIKSSASGPSCPKPASAPAPAKPAAAPANDDSDDGVDLFASDSEGEDEAAAKLKEQRVAEYAAKKSKKPVLIAKSNIILDVKPWSDETDMAELQEQVRTVKADGLLWGAAKLVPLAYGIQKLQISCVVEDDKISIDWLQEELEKFEEYVQSVDIAAFNKV